jgi:cytochrome b
MRETEAKQSMAARRVPAWDLPTRLFHWALALLVLNAYLTAVNRGDLSWHIWNGYAILVLVVFRILWGFVGSSTSRFASFIHSPARWLTYTSDFLLRRPRRYLGHNPLGGVVVLVMLVLVGLQGVLGLFSYDDKDALAGGPLSSRVSEETVAAASAWHRWMFYYAILVVVALHIMAAVLYLVWKRENLITPMLSGRKPLGEYEDEAGARLAPGWRALVCLGIALVIVFGGIMLAGGKPF